MQVIYRENTLRKTFYGSEENKIVRTSKSARRGFQVKPSVGEQTTEFVLLRDEGTGLLYPIGYRPFQGGGM